MHLTLNEIPGKAGSRKHNAIYVYRHVLKLTFYILYIFICIIQIKI